MSNLESILNEIQIAINMGDHLAAGTACSSAGQILLERNLYPEAATYYREASKYFADSDETTLQAKSLNHLGICLVMEEDADSALNILSEALALLGPSPDTNLLAAIQGNFGLAHSARGDYVNAIKSHKSVLETAEESGDDQLRLNALINLADVNLQDNNYQAAHGFALVALDLAKALESNPGLALIYDLLGMISSHQGNLKTAIEYHQRSHLVAQEIGDLHRQAIAIANKGLALERLTDMEEALAAMRQAEDLFVMLNSEYLDRTRRDIQRIQKGMR
jgi:tetratricopeptide (TPR) repeat protein